MTLLAGTPIGKYIVRRKLAEGGMAEIFLASVRGPEGFEKDVVIKRIRSFMSNDPGFVQMFISEARLASRLNHANIVQLFDFDKHGDSFYIAMEYVRGRSLRDVRQKCREKMVAFPATLVAHIGLEVARALHYAHQLREKGRPVNLVHRDVTPHNVLLSWEGAVKLTDFGIAKGSNKLTAPGMLKGKFAYMSPEQARGDEVDARTDVFALGIVLWEMLTGGRLFEGDSDIAVLRSVQQSNIPPPGRLNPDVPAELDEVVMRALRRDPATRFQSAQELERALGQFILGHAKSVDDTDLSGFLQRLYADEVGDERFDRTASGVRAPTPEELAQDAARAGDSASSSLAVEPVATRREPTAVMPGRTRSKPDVEAVAEAAGAAPSGASAPVVPAAADDDAFADTHVLQRPGQVALPSASAVAVPMAAEREPSFPSASGGASAQPGLPQHYALKGGDGTAVSRVRAEVAPSPSPGRSISGSQSVVVAPEALTPAPAALARTAPPGAASDVSHGAVARTGPGESTAFALHVKRSAARRWIVAAGALAVAGIAVAAGFIARGGSNAPEVMVAGEGGDVAGTSASPHVQSPPAGTPPAVAAPAVARPPTPTGTEAAPAAPAAPSGVAAAAGGAAPGGSSPNGTARPDDAERSEALAAAAPDAKSSADDDEQTSGATRRTSGGRGSRTTPLAVASRAKGTLVITATPWANVFIDGKARGEVSGSREFTVPAGKYVVKFAHPKKSVERVVTVRDGRRQTVVFDLFQD